MSDKDINAPFVPARGEVTVSKSMADGRPCPVCGERFVAVMHQQRLVLPTEFRLPEEFNVVICSLCGMTYSDVAINPESLTAYYRAETYAFGSEVNASGSMGKHMPSSCVDVPRLRGVVKQLLRRFQSRDVRLLDVGCASGALLTLLEDAGFTDVQGIDPSLSAISAANRIGHRAWAGVAEDVLATMGMFDVVVFSHVLEHMSRPREAIERLREVLQPGGIVYAEVPDASRYAEFLVEPFVDFNVEHINHFSIGHLDELFHACGFTTAVSGRNDSELTENWPYPTIFGMWQMLDTPCIGGSLEPTDNEAFHAEMVRYVSMSRELLARYDQQIAAKLAGRRRVAVRCLGHRAWTLLAGTMLRDLDVVAYIDSSPSKQGLTIRGIRITGPDAPLADGVPIVVLAYNVEAAIVREYAKSDPEREVITLGRSLPASQSAATA